MYTLPDAEAARNWGLLIVGAVMVASVFWWHLRARQRRPQFQRSDIVYQGWFASGASERDLLTRLGGANNCLRLVVTRDLLWVSLSPPFSLPPFSLLAAVYDLEHVIPLESIVSVEQKRRWWTRTLRLTYTDATDTLHTLALTPKHPDRFLEALGRHGEG